MIYQISNKNETVLFFKSNTPDRPVLHCEVVLRDTQLFVLELEK